MTHSYVGREDPASRIIGTILLDYVAESAMKTVYWSSPATAPKARTHIPFPELLAKIATLSGDPPTLSLQIEIANLHDQRNSTQHRNVLPSAEDLSKNAAYVEAFVRQVFHDFFGVEFDYLSLTTLVASDELRRHVEAAERHLNASRYLESVEESAIALDKVAGWAAKSLGLRSSRYHRSIVAFDAKTGGFTQQQGETLGEILEKFNEVVHGVEEQLRLLATGVDLELYRRYKSIAPWGVWTYDDVHYDFHHRKDEYDESDAVAMFDYALNQVLRLEALGALTPGQDEL